MGCPVLATAAVAEAMPDAWVPAGQRCMADFQREVALFTYRMIEAQEQSAAE